MKYSIEMEGPQAGLSGSVSNLNMPVFILFFIKKRAKIEFFLKKQSIADIHTKKTFQPSENVFLE